MNPVSTAYHLATLIIVATSLNALGAAELFKQWDVSYGGLDYEECTTIYPTSDGGCVVAGGSFSSPSGNKTSTNYGEADYWFLKLDENGNKDWEHVYGGETNEYPNRIQPTSDGGYLLAGWSESPISGNKTISNFNSGDFWQDYWLVKTDGSGNKLWERVFGGNDEDTCWCLGMATNRYLLGGWSYSGTSGNKSSGNFSGADGWVVNVDTNGNKQWEAVFGGNYGDFIYDAQPTSDGGFILVGESDSDQNTGNKVSPWYGGTDGWIIKIDANGNKVWEMTYGGEDDEWFDVGLQVADGYIIGGTSYSDNTGIFGNKTSPNMGFADWWVLKLDTNGNKVWEMAYGGDDYDFQKSIVPTEDGGYLVYGTSWSGANGNKTIESLGDSDYWLIKIDANGNKIWEQAFGGIGRDFAVNSLVQASDIGYIMGGYSETNASGNKTSSSHGDFDYWVVKVSPPVLSIDPVGSEQVNVSWTPATEGLVLQENSDLTSPNWTNSTSGSNNPAMLPTTMPSTIYRISSP